MTFKSDEGVYEEGPWHLYYDKGRVVGIGSHDFTHDVMFNISGDFGDNDEKARYGNEIVRRLNAYGAAVEPSNAAYTHEACRALVELMERKEFVPEEEYSVLERKALYNARIALTGKYEKYKFR